MDLFVDAVDGPGEGVMPKHDNPQTPEASKQPTRMDNSDIESKDNSKVCHPIQANWGQLPAKYSDNVVWNYLLLL